MTGKKTVDKNTTKTVAEPVPDDTAPLLQTPATGFPIVGIGASAGGLAAFEAFFSGMPADKEPGMAFVLVQHLAPDHKSILSELVRRYTRMQVFEVVDGMKIEANCAYIIPPNHDMAFLDGTLQLLEPSAPRGQRLPIDFFFRSLALDQHEKAIGIVLSGTGSDGTLGIRAIKSEGGMAMAQTPASTEYSGMPQSAIDTGLVDYILAPAEMPARLMAYTTHAYGRLLPLHAAAAPEPGSENALRKIFMLLRGQTGHDFSQYKPNTVHRRIARRMAVHQVDTMDGYAKLLQQTPAEVEALFRDMLIGVTGFFRDPEAFRLLEEQIIPKILNAKAPGSCIRVWSPGCSSGEEAYSIAILLQERLETLRQSYRVQIFATDIDSQAIMTARTGVYPASIAADISPERLARFFSAEPGGDTYRIHKSIRDLLIFSEQDVIKDPPFSRLDLITCRNLMIYLGGELQKKILPLFHYAINPGGYLFLGTSESVNEFCYLFTTLDRKLKLYQRRDDYHGALRTALNRIEPSMMTSHVTQSRPATKAIETGRLPLRDLTERTLLQHLSAVAALVDAYGEIFYLHGRSGRYLEPAQGETGRSNIVKMAREGLRHELTAALHQATTGREIVHRPGLRVKTNGDFTPVNLTVRPVTRDLDTPIGELETSAATAGPVLYLVILEQAAAFETASHSPAGSSAGTGASISGGDDFEARIAGLRDELRTKEEYLQAANEELETSNEELKSSNEEMQSVNEELQSTNEELETSKEELQSINEELATVNAELQTKVHDLSRANNDMNNLLAGTGIGTVFVDHQLRILRFTPTATRIINLIPGDVGRPVGHVVSNLVGYDRLLADTREVLRTLVPIEVEVEAQTGAWYTMRILPYRTLENVIEGAVITFVDISERKRVENALKETEARLQQLADARRPTDA